MLKKRIIFVLLWSHGNFMLSRNFRLQAIGDFDWLIHAYNFARIRDSIDELALINVSREPVPDRDFLCVVEKLKAMCFMPMSVGGGVRSGNDASGLFKAGADKVILNGSFWIDKGELPRVLSERYGVQAVIASIDHIRGELLLKWPTEKRLDLLKSLTNPALACAGELLLNDVDRDGTGFGLDFRLLSDIRDLCNKPMIVMGGVGTPQHIASALLDPAVDAVATSNLLAFIGDGLTHARGIATSVGVSLPSRTNLGQCLEE